MAVPACVKGRFGCARSEGGMWGGGAGRGQAGIHEDEVVHKTAERAASKGMDKAAGGGSVAVCMVVQ